MPISIEADPTLAQGYIKVNGTTAATVTSTGLTTASLQDNAVTTLKVNNAAITAAKLDGAQSGSAPIYGCRAWVNFNGAAGSTVDGEFRCTIRGSGNVSKVVRNSTGNFTIYFTTAMPSTNYAAVMYNNAAATGTTSVSFNNNFLGGMGDKTTTTLGVTSYNTNPTASYINSTLFDVIIFG